MFTVSYYYDYCHSDLIQADLGDTADLVPDHSNKATVII